MAETPVQLALPAVAPEQNHEQKKETDRKLQADKEALLDRLRGLREQLKRDVAKAEELGLENADAVSYWRWVLTLTPYAAAMKKK